MEKSKPDDRMKTYQVPAVAPEFPLVSWSGGLGWEKHIHPMAFFLQLHMILQGKESANCLYFDQLRTTHVKIQITSQSRQILSISAVLLAKIGSRGPGPPPPPPPCLQPLPGNRGATLEALQRGLDRPYCVRQPSHGFKYIGFAHASVLVLAFSHHQAGVTLDAINLAGFKCTPTKTCTSQ
jgi:hypothetical protein